MQYLSSVSCVRAVLALSFVMLTSCVDHGQARVAFASTVPSAEIEEVLASARPKPMRDGRVVLITLDGVRAEDVFDGADPSLKPGAQVSHLASPDAVMPRTRKLVATRGVALGSDRPGCGSRRCWHVSATSCRTCRDGRGVTRKGIAVGAAAGLSDWLDMLSFAAAQDYCTAKFLAGDIP